MRDILAAIGRGHERAKLAFDIYVHRLRAAMAAAMGGMDVLVFTAGVVRIPRKYELRFAVAWSFSAFG